jgi:hypothetical protein
MLVDLNSRRGSVVLRGIEIDLDSDIGAVLSLIAVAFAKGCSPRTKSSRSMA